MKNLFLIILGALIAYAQVMTSRQQASGNGIEGSRVVLWWATDPNPFREHQIALFRTWLKNKGLPDVEVRIDPASAGLQKVIIQGTTGVADDLIDAYALNVRYLENMGLVADLSSIQDRVRPTFGAISNLIYADGRLVGYPRNINLTGSLMVNRDAFKKVGMTPPEGRWSLDEFERVGIEYTEKANRGLSRLKYFFADGIPTENIRRSLGISLYNETMTALAVDRPEYIAIQKRINKWRLVDHLVPLAADQASFVVDSGFGNASHQLFQRGEIALLASGRWALIQIRRMKGTVDIGGCEAPNGGFPNGVVSMSGVCVYKGTRHPVEAGRFIEFLSSLEHGLLVCDGADSMPAVPEVLNRDELLKPVGFTNEWPYHQVSAKVLAEISLGQELSPFVDPNEMGRTIGKLYQSFDNGLLDAEALSKQITDVGRQAFGKYLARHPELAAKYEAACQKQRDIDALKAKGEKIPLALVDNPFFKGYYKATGEGLVGP